MALWFWKKHPVEPKWQTVDLVGGVGTIQLPDSFVVEQEDESTLMAYPADVDSVTLRVSTISFRSNDGRDDAAIRFVSKGAAEMGREHRTVGDKAVSTWEEFGEEDGVKLIYRYWEIGMRNSVTILSATILENDRNCKAAAAVLKVVPQIIASLQITKVHRTVTADDGNEVHATETVVANTPQSIRPITLEERAWLDARGSDAHDLSVRYGSGGALDPPELDRVFVRWMSEDVDRESPEFVAHALGTAFGEFLLENHPSQWVVVTDDEFGTDYGVKTPNETISYPIASVFKRIDSGDVEFFAAVYTIFKDREDNAMRERTSP